MNTTVAFERTDKVSGLQPDDMDFIYNFVIKHKCTSALEVGMADGMSSVAILSGMAKNSTDFKLKSIDPWQNGHWNSNGLKNVKSLGFGANHELMETMDIFALPKLVESGEKYDLIFIDGNHTFDHVLHNNFYADYLLKVGGFIINDDIWMPSIQRVCAYLTNNYTHLQIIEDHHPRFGPIYKKICEKNINWDEYIIF